MRDEFNAYILRLFDEPDESEIRHRWMQAREALLYQAQKAAKQSRSYRPFPVGCMVMAYKRTHDWTQRWGYFRGANIKVSKQSPKICAEAIAIGAALQQGYERIVGMAIVGQPQPDNGSGIESATLHPCEACRALFREVPIVKPCTHLVLGRPMDDGEFFTEDMTVEDVWRIHDDTPMEVVK